MRIRSERSQAYHVGFTLLLIVNRVAILMTAYTLNAP
jgi:hypothetical protein